MNSSGTRRMMVSAVAVIVVALLGSGAAARAAAPAEGPVHVPAGEQVVAGQYLVTLEPGSGLFARTSAPAIAAEYGGSVRRVYRSALNGFLLSAAPEQARRLAADPRVARVEADTVVSGAAVRWYPVWNLDRIDQRTSVLDDAYTYPDAAGAGVTVYVLDTGIRTSHVEFTGRASVGFDAIDDGWDGQDCNADGHGTHVAGIVGGVTYGMAETVEVVSVRVLGCNNLGTVSQIIAGVDWVTGNAAHPAVVNMSLGGGRSPTEDDAVAASIASGVTYVVAAGNREENACNFSPAAVPEAITVAASNSLDERARGWGGVESGSNYGSCVDLFAPGQEIRSAHNATDQATRVLRGTSMASPHVAGAAALILSVTPEATPAQVADQLVASATAGTLRADTLGFGSPNLLLHSTDPLTLAG